MYIDLTLGISLIGCIAASEILMAVLAAVGWVNFAKEVHKNRNLKALNFKQQQKIRSYQNAEIIRTANAYAKEKNDEQQNNNG